MMKNLITYILLLSPLLTMAQKDTLNISYSEEKVENFERTTLIDEYEKAYGANRVVKSALRIAFNPSSGFFSTERDFSIEKNLIKDLDMTLQFEQKIGVDKSLIASFNRNRNKNNLIWNSTIGLEGRWYYQMKKRVKEGKQQPNITGRYVSFRGEANPYEYNPTLQISLDENPLPTFMLRATSTYSFKWGWQFGNGLDYGFSAGIKHGNKATINSKNYWINENQPSITGITPFITTNAQISTGIYLPFRRRVSTDYCDFLQCNYEVRRLFKVNVNNAFYFDRYSQNARLDIAYERKIGRSPFSINSNVVAGFFNYTIYKPTGLRVDTTFNEHGNITSILTHQTYSSDLQSFVSYNFEISEQFRYYIGMQKRIADGKSASNLNGMYIAILGSYRTQRGKGYRADLTSVSYLNTSMNQLSMGISLGSQIQTNRNSFVDISLNLLKQKYATTLVGINNQSSMNTLMELYLKFGFAK